MLIASSLLLYTLINLLFIITRLYGLLIESSTIYFQLFQRIHRSILIRKRNQTRRNPQDSSICLNLFPPYSRKVDYKQDAIHTHARTSLISPSVEAPRAHRVTASSAETKVETRRASPSQGNLAPAWANVLAGWLVFQRSPPVWESRATFTSPPSLPPIGSTSHRIFITVPVTNKLLIPCRVLDSHFCRLCLDSFCLALHASIHRSLLPYSIPVPLFISLSPPAPLFPYNTRSTYRQS